MDWLEWLAMCAIVIAILGLIPLVIGMWLVMGELFGWWDLPWITIA